MDNKTYRFGDICDETCPKHPDVHLESGWQGPECPRCEREFLISKGCRCDGDGRCPECKKEETRTGDRDAKCEANCDGLCPVCNPDS